ncbi:MAG: hypothetical protein IAE99_08295 [Rhodothermales bacterium]|nr:hypothetical protein [Rhodothermales bacterium]
MAVPNIDFRLNPWRGVLAEVAAREGVSRQAIRQALLSGNARIAQLVREAVEARRAELSRAQAAGVPIPTERIVGAEG